MEYHNQINHKNTYLSYKNTYKDGFGLLWLVIFASIIENGTPGNDSAGEKIQAEVNILSSFVSVNFIQSSLIDKCELLEFLLAKIIIRIINRCDLFEVHSVPKVYHFEHKRVKNCNQDVV